ncbi:MAG: phosphatidate cytidylyltransferase [FCB group bacterium]|nr:phosphatidate cytidylyltransferase [FCB group bacterium]
MTDTIRKRLLVTFLGVPGILLMTWLGGYWFSLFTLCVMLIAVFEWKLLLKPIGAQPVIAVLLAGVLLQFLSFTKFALLDQFEILLIVGVLTALVEIFRKTSLHTLNISTTLLGFVWIGLFIGGLAPLRFYEAGGYQIGFELSIAMFVTVWLCDTAAYIMGSQFGNRKILPDVSPNKTWMGCVSGVVAAFISMLVFYYSGFFKGFINLRDALMLALIFGVLGQLGDFAESMLKREAGLKDTGSFLMGHGGVLDRFDSLAITAPITYIYARHFIL